MGGGRMQDSVATAGIGDWLGTPLWLEVDAWLWLYVAFIAVTFLWLLGSFLWSRRALRIATDQALATFQRLGPSDDEVRRDGRSLAAVDSWRDATKKLSGAARQWLELTDCRLVMLTDAAGARRFKLRDGEGEQLTEESFYGSTVNLRLLDSAPSLLTALGLLGTFLALALALRELRPGALPGTFDGLDELVRGLSGKFISSIAALLLALVLQWLDAIALRPLYRDQHRRFLEGVDRSFPTLSAAQQLATLLEVERKQEKALSNISSDIVDKFTDVFDSGLLPKLSAALATSVHTEIGPSLARVAEGLATLDEGIRRLESGKTESLGEELRRLTTALEQSLRTSLEQMGGQFREALSGSAGKEFDNAAKALEASATVLQGMNASFETMQASMERLLADAEARSARAFDEGEGRTRALNDLVERLIGQLNETASQSAGEVQRLLVQAVSGLGARFNQISAELEQRVRDAAVASTDSAGVLIRSSTEAAERTTAETERVLNRLAERIEDFDRAAEQLRELREGVERVLAESGQKVRDLQEAAGAFRVVATEAATLTRQLKESQDQHRKSAETAAGMVSQVNTVVTEQSRLLGETRDTFDLARTVLDGLDQRLAASFAAVTRHMQQYNEQVELNFSTIMSKVNEKMPDLFEKLERNLQQVHDAVEDLNQTVDKITRNRS